MRILLVNVPHPAIGSRIPREQLPPLGMLAIGGPLIDDGHDVELLDGELGPLPLDRLVAEVKARAPDAVLFGHSGSSSAQPIISSVAAEIAAQLPAAWIIYGGVHPTYFWREVLADEPYVHAVVRGEGEETARRLMQALEDGTSLDDVPGIAFRRDDVPVGTPAAPVITNLDAYRVGWELIDHAHYTYWGGKRAVVVQFSRGCPHLCNYCGQRGFWTRWRHRDPVLLAVEIARLHREHGVEVFNFADENPSAGRKPWRAFLEALIAEDIWVTLVGSTRADDIVRDADILHLYKQAGFERFLLGMENTDEATLKLIRKGGAISSDREAIRLLRRHGMRPRVSRWRITATPSASTPCTWNTFFARSRPIVVTLPIVVLLPALRRSSCGRVGEPSTSSQADTRSFPPASRNRPLVQLLSALWLVSDQPNRRHIVGVIMSSHRLLGCDLP